MLAVRVKQTLHLFISFFSWTKTVFLLAGSTEGKIGASCSSEAPWELETSNQ